MIFTSFELKAALFFNYKNNSVSVGEEGGRVLPLQTRSV